MNDQLVFQWPMLVMPLAALVYFELMRWLDRVWANRSPLTEEEILSLLARSRSVSEYHIFHLAADTWSIGRAQVEEDFKDYLQEGNLPHYVRDYLRRQRQASS